MKKLILWILVMTCISVAASAAQLPAMPGMEAPDFEVVLTNGETFRLSEQRGKVVILNIWATWCGPCVAEMPAIEQLSQDYAEELVVIGINCGEREETIRSFVEEKGYTYLFAADEEYLISGMLYPTSVIPFTVVIDADGMVSTLHQGGGANMYEVLEGYVLEAIESTRDTKVSIFA